MSSAAAARSASTSRTIVEASATEMRDATVDAFDTSMRGSGCAPPEACTGELDPEHVWRRVGGAAAVPGALVADPAATTIVMYTTVVATTTAIARPRRRR